MSVVVLGASGFLGRHITGALRSSDHDVIAIGRSGSMDVVVNPTDTGDLESVLRGLNPSWVINLLGAGLSDPNADVQVMEEINARFPAHLAHILSKAAPRCHLIHTASSTEAPAADGSYESQYSRTKAEGTAVLASFGGDLPITILRVHNTYGGDQPAQRFVASAIDSLAAGRKVELRYSARVRDFIHVDDVAAAFVTAVDDPLGERRTYEVGTGIGTSLSSVVRIIASIVGVEDPLITPEQHEDLHPLAVASTGSLLRPATIDLRSGLELVVSERLRRGEGT